MRRRSPAGLLASQRDCHRRRDGRRRRTGRPHPEVVAGALARLWRGLVAGAVINSYGERAPRKGRYRVSMRGRRVEASGEAVRTMAVLIRF